MLGRGTVPVFTRLDSERDDTSAVAYGRFQDLTDNRGIGSMVRQAIYRSGQDVGGATGAQLDRIERSVRSEEHTSELQSLMRISYAVFCLKKTHHLTE